MTRKKMRKTIIIGILIFYIASLLMVFYASLNTLSIDFHDIFGNTVYANQHELFRDFENDITDEGNLKISNCNEGELFAYYLSEYFGNVNYPFSFAVLDEELNTHYIANNFIVINWWDKGVDQFVSFDEYLSEKTRDEISKFIRKADNNYYSVSDLRLYENDEICIPVSMILRCHDKRGNELREEFKITNYTANVIIDKEAMGKSGISVWPFLRELEAPFYHKDNFKKYKERLDHNIEMNKEYFNTNGGGGSLGGGDCSYSCGYEINRKGYEIYVVGGFDVITHTLFSGVFNAYAFYLTILFLIAGYIFYIICMRVVKKNEKLEEAKSTFISAASHELKTPLAVIQNQCECIMENVAPEKNSEYINSIYDEALRMNSIVSSLLSYNKISQMTRIEKEKCNLSELLREEVKTYRKFAQSSGVTIEENIAGEIYINCNPQLMKMAIDNYLSNAIKYSVGDKRIEVNLIKNKSSFTLAVINPADKESVDTAKDAWDEFSRADKARQRKGESIGMGLAICKKIFELHSFKGYCKYNEGKVSFVITGT